MHGVSGNKLRQRLGRSTRLALHYGAQPGRRLHPQGMEHGVFGLERGDHAGNSGIVQRAQGGKDVLFLVGMVVRQGQFEVAQDLRRSITRLLVGAVPVALLAIATELIFGGIERAMTSKGIKVQAA